MTLLDKFKRISQTIDKAEYDRHQELLSLPETDLQHWLAKVRAATIKDQVLPIVDAFRLAGGWTDEQSSAMARCYVRKLEQL